MAYMSQEKKAKIAPVVKALCAKYGVKASIAVRNHSTLVLNIKSGKLDFIGNFNQRVADNDPTLRYQFAAGSLDVNPYWYQDHFTGRVKEFLAQVITAMNDGNHNNSDPQTDYFDVGWYIDVNVGKWNKPYVLEK